MHCAMPWGTVAARRTWILPVRVFLCCEHSLFFFFTPHPLCFFFLLHAIMGWWKRQAGGLPFCIPLLFFLYLLGGLCLFHFVALCGTMTMKPDFDSDADVTHSSLDVCLTLPLSYIYVCALFSWEFSHCNNSSHVMTGSMLSFGVITHYIMSLVLTFSKTKWNTSSRFSSVVEFLVQSSCLLFK